MTDRPRTAALFDERAADYDAWFRGPVGAALLPTELAAVRLLLDQTEPPRLEVGVGSGAFAGPLGVDVGLDPSRSMLGYARRRGVASVLGVGEALPFADEALGAILLIVTLCFLDDPAAAFAEAARALRPSGALLVAEIPAESAWGRYYGTQAAAGHLLYRQARFLTLRQTRTLLGDAGFRLSGYASTLLQPPSERPAPERAAPGLAPGASFVCVLARKEG